MPHTLSTTSHLPQIPPSRFPTPQTPKPPNPKSHPSHPLPKPWRRPPRHAHSPTPRVYNPRHAYAADVEDECSGGGEEGGDAAAVDFAEDREGFSEKEEEKQTL